MHHTNRDTTDSGPENLQALAAPQRHVALEHFGRREARGLNRLFDADTWLEKVEQKVE